LRSIGASDGDIIEEWLVGPWDGNPSSLVASLLADDRLSISNKGAGGRVVRRGVSIDKYEVN